MSTDPREFEHPIDGSGTIPTPEAIEAAAIAFYVAVQPNRRKPEDWQDVRGVWKKSYRDQATAALTAAAPIIQAEALRAAAVSADDPGLLEMEFYQLDQAQVGAWLRAHANHLEGKSE